MCVFVHMCVYAMCGKVSMQPEEGFGSPRMRCKPPDMEGEFGPPEEQQA